MTTLFCPCVSASIAYDFSDSLTLKSITAYRRLNTDDYIDFDATADEVSSALVAVEGLIIYGVDFTA